jgi:hypothetical protein
MIRGKCAQLKVVLDKRIVRRPHYGESHLRTGFDELVCVGDAWRILILKSILCESLSLFYSPYVPLTFFPSKRSSLNSRKKRQKRGVRALLNGQPFANVREGGGFRSFP